MRGEESIGNVSNLMANYVHPEDKGKREALSDNLKFNLNKALKEETGVTFGYDPENMTPNQQKKSKTNMQQRF